MVFQTFQCFSSVKIELKGKKQELWSNCVLLTCEDDERTAEKTEEKELVHD